MEWYRMSGGGTDTSDATATASNILSGKTAYVNDNKITGTMANRGGTTVTTSSVTKDSNYVYLTVPSTGYYSTSSKIKTARSNILDTSGLEVYDKILNKSVSTLPYYFNFGNAVVLNGEIHLLGSFSTDYRKKHYKWNGSSWVSVSTLPFEFRSGCQVVVLNGEIHIFNTLNNTTKKHYKWNGSSWVSVSTLPFESNEMFIAVVLNSEIHILGATKHYKWNGSSWVSVSTLSFDINNSYKAVVLNSEIHILAATKHYKWNGSSWVSVSTLPYDTYYSSVLALGGEIRILGGDNDTSSYSTKHYKWNGSSWVSVSTLPYKFEGGSVVKLNSEIHILGGYLNSYTSTVSKNHYSIEKVYYMTPAELLD